MSAIVRCDLCGNTFDTGGDGHTCDPDARIEVLETRVYELEQNEFTFEERCLILHGLETLYRQERGEIEKAPFHDHDMGTDQWETLLELRKRFRKLVKV